MVFFSRHFNSIIVPFRFLIVEWVFLSLLEGSNGLKWRQSKKSPVEFAEEVVKEADQFNGFNLILADTCSKTMVYVTNRPNDGQKLVTNVLPGIHVLTNASLDTPWPKVRWYVTLFYIHNWHSLLETESQKVLFLVHYLEIIVSNLKKIISPCTKST